ncbi:MAG: glyoxalase [Actinobacteria bacterium]|nr:glyoxalase [Actinomycetota bacterium]
MSAQTFSHVLTVAIPVTDQDHTKALLQRLGFEDRFDMELQPGFRWIELGLPGSPMTVSLVQTGDALPVGIDTGVRLCTPDARAAHATLSAEGLDVGELLDWETAPLMFTFVDPDGNRFYVTENPKPA